MVGTLVLLTTMASQIPKGSQGGLSPPKGVWGFPPKKEMAGRAAAGTLGYIVGDIPGAVGADILYQTMTNGMRTPKRTPTSKRTRSVSRGRPAKKSRARSVSFSRSRSRVSRSRSRVSGDRVHTDDYHALGTHKGKAVVAKKKKTVKLKPAMKQAIKQVLMPGDHTGRFNKRVTSFLWFGGVSPGGIYGTGNYNNKQRLDYLSVPSAFEPNALLEAARVLWKNAPQPASSTPAAYDSAVDFGLTNFKPTVINAYCKIKFRNNSGRAYHMDLMIIRPKKRAAGLEPRGDLEAQLAARAEAATPGNAGGNVLSDNYEKFGMKPTDVDGWRANWACETITILLQPGQTYEYFCQGPRNQEINFAKLLNGNIIQADQKFTRFFLVRFHTDLITSSGTAIASGTAGYYAEIGNLSTNLFDGRGIAVDQTFHMHMKMPDNAGFQYPATVTGSTEQELNKRRNAFVYLNYFTDPVGSIIRIDDEAGGALSND